MLVAESKIKSIRSIRLIFESVSVFTILIAFLFEMTCTGRCPYELKLRVRETINNKSLIL